MTSASHDQELDIGALSTEGRNERSRNLDTMSVTELLTVMNNEDRSVPLAIASQIDQIAEAVELVTMSLSNGGRLIYLGAGTSGRIGLLDAVECPPTFGTGPDQVMVLLAGGNDAFTHAAEGAEDSAGDAIADIDGARVDGRDTVVGLAASGRTPYVVSGLDRARERGASTVSIACNRDAVSTAHADVGIEVDTGPEVLTGSTRLKAGTAQKLICNMLSTAAMVQLGKSYQNLMIDMRPTNEKLFDRARRIVATAAEVDLETAGIALTAAGNLPKVATVMLVAGVDELEARRRLKAANGSVRWAISN